VVASNCSPQTPVPSLPTGGLPVNPPVHPALHRVASQPALCPITVHPPPRPDASQPALWPTPSYPSIQPPTALAKPFFIPATTPSVPTKNVHDLRLKQLQTSLLHPANTKQQPHPLPISEPDDKRIATPPARLTALPSRSTQLISNHTPHNISCQALYHIINLGFGNPPAISIPRSLARNHYTGPIIEIKEYCNGVVHPVTKETITHDRKLMKDPILKDLWTKAISKEIHCLAQGCTGITKGTNTISFLLLSDICNIPEDRTVIYAWIVIDHHPQKEDSNFCRGPWLSDIT
jgi:hypothetical protein